MSTQTLKLGGLYITPTGKPVKILSATNTAILLKSLTSDNQFSVSGDYSLRVLRKNELPAGFRGVNPTEDEAGGAIAPRKLLAPLIDAMLLRGGITMRGIVRELRRKASASCKNRDVTANVRARLYWFKRKGYSVERKVEGQIKVTR